MMAVHFLSEVKPGPIVLFGSGETSVSGQKVFGQVLRKLPHRPRVALLETPAGFEVNSAREIGRVVEFFQQRLNNDERQKARAYKDWATSDAMRNQIARLSWQVEDISDGLRLKKG